MILLSRSGFPHDIRVEKEISALETAGWSATVVTFNTGAQPHREAFGKGHTIIRIPPYVPTRFQNALFGFYPFPRQLVDTLSEIFSEENPDVVHVHDLVYAGTVLRAARGKNKPVVLDLHENMPAAFAAYQLKQRPGLRRLYGALIRNTLLWKHYEKRWVREAARTLIVTERARDRFGRQTQLVKDTIRLVGNTENLDTFPTATRVAPVDPDTPVVRLLYFGGVGPHRGLETVLEALPALRDEPIEFIVVGLKEHQHAQYADLVDRLGVADKVTLRGWAGPDEVVNVLSEFEFGLVPHRNLEHTNTTIPHKLFQYMLAERPVIVSSCPPLAEVVEGSNCGYVFAADDPRDFARVVQQALRERDRYSTLAANAKNAALTTWNWDHDAQRLISTYEELVPGGSQETT